MPQSTAVPSPELAETPAGSPKSLRVLSCLLCQQRKVKCDRRFPCARCLRAGVQCVPANTLTPRQRRRRFPERELLERLRHYEGLLHQHDIDFEPLHPDGPSPAPAPLGHSSPSEHAHAEVSGSSKDAQPHNRVAGKKADVKPKDAVVDIFHAINHVTVDSEDDDGDGNDNVQEYRHIPHRDRDAVLESAWSHRFQIGFKDPEADDISDDLATLHPEQVQIFRLWQIYLDNVNPLLRVTHTPTLQPRIIDAAGDMANIGPALEALIFSIYCISVVSLTEDECRTLFQSSKTQLLARYQSGCKQALLKCHAWRSGGVDGLTAIYLYLMSVRHQTDPRSLSCMLAVAIRTAQRMGIHNESSYTGRTILEAEMRRRLWWSLVMFDHRTCEMSDLKTTKLEPTWDCGIPLNVNDFEIRPDTKTPPTVYDRPTEALFAVVWSELADYIRNSAYHLNFVNPTLNAIARSKVAQGKLNPENSELDRLERMIEDKYLAYCDMEDPVHYMATWIARGTLARNRLLEHYSKHSISSARPTDLQRGEALSHTISMLECDTKIRTSPLTKKYMWLANFYFPALAYLHILMVLGKRPAEAHAERSWDAMNSNYEALAACSKQSTGEEHGGTDIFFLTYSRAILQAWEAREALLRQQQQPPEQPPRIVSNSKMRRLKMGSTLTSSDSNEGQPVDSAVDMNSTGGGSQMLTTPFTFGDSDGTADLQGFAGLSPAGSFPEILGQGMMDVDMGQFWSGNLMDWRWMHTQGW